jgi:hypothetical protein
MKHWRLMGLGDLLERHPNYSGKTWVDSLIAVLITLSVTALLLLSLASAGGVTGRCAAPV